MRQQLQKTEFIYKVKKHQKFKVKEEQFNDKCRNQSKIKEIEQNRKHVLQLNTKEGTVIMKKENVVQEWNEYRVLS